MAGLNKSEVSGADNNVISSMPKIEKKEKMVKVKFLHPAYLGDAKDLETIEIAHRHLLMVENSANYGEIKELPKSKADYFLNLKMKKNILNADKYVTDLDDPRLMTEVPVAILAEESN